MNRQAYDAFIQYQSIRLHFNNWKFNSLISRANISAEAFVKRRDAYQFQRLSEYIKDRDVLREFLVSSFLKNSNAWVGDMLSDEYIEYHQGRMKRVVSLDSTLEIDSGRFLFLCSDEGVENIKEGLTCNGGNVIITRSGNGISRETQAVYDAFFRFSDKPCLDPLWEETRKSVHKYSIIIKWVMKKNPKQLASIKRTVANVIANFENEGT